MALSRKGFQAPWNIAVVWFLSSVNSKVSLKIAFLIKSSLAFFKGANIFFLSQVSFQMHV